MNEQELRETIELLRQAGVEPMLCDTPIQVSENGVKCGVPTEPGDDALADYILLPKEIVGPHPEMLIPADGDSMIDAGFEPGDQLRVRFGVTAHDGDSALFWIDGRCTVKSLFTDEQGQMWLVPRNDAYDPILLTEDMDVRVLGVVVSVEKAAVRASTRQMIQAVRRMKNKQRTVNKLTAEEVDALIVQAGGEVVHARQWYAVYRAMLDFGVQEDGDFSGFAARIHRLLPEHTHLPDPKELSRVCVQSFSKPVSMWTESNAPVSGARYRDYLRIARFMAALLSGEN